MTTRHYLQAIIFRLVIMVGLTMAASYLYFTKYQIFWSIIALLVVAALVVNTIVYINRINRWIASFLLGIENEDTTLKIPIKTGNKAIDEIFKGETMGPVPSSSLVMIPCSHIDVK